MNENEKLNNNLPEAKITGGKGVSIIWIFPIIAALIGIWLIYQSYLQRGIPITIIFESGEGIVKKETLIKYDGVTVGVVDSVELSEDKKSVIVGATLDKTAADLARGGSQFWVVRPRFHIGGISGLDTIISGEYIKVRMGKGKQQSHFVGLNHPPLGDPDAPGLHIILKSNRLGSLSEGSPVLFREIEVGQVYGHTLSEDEKSVQIHALIYENYMSLVKHNSKFWNASGITVTGGISSGFKVQTESLTSVLTGGIAFETPNTTSKEENICKNWAVFKLYDNKETAMEGGFTVKISFKSGDGIIPGSTMVKYKGLNIGQVTKVEIDEDLKGVAVFVSLKEAAKNVAVEGSQFWVVKPRFSLEGISGISTLVSGQYIEVIPGKGEPAYSFAGLEKQPVTEDEASGLRIRLIADNLKSLTEGSPVYFKKIKVGKIHNYELSDDHDLVYIHAYIYKKFEHLVRKNSRFWNVTGINVSAGLSGVKINTHSLSALIDGGITFETPDSKNGEAPQCKDGATFTLYDDYDSAVEAGIPLTITFKNGQGLKSGQTLIKYQGLVVGKVKTVGFNKNMDGVIVQALLYKASENLAVKGSLFWIERPKFTIEGVSGLSTLLSGEYIEVQPGKGPPTRSFAGLEEPPVGDMLSQGLHIVLSAKKLGSLKAGNPILHKDFEVGKIQGIEMSDTGDKIQIHVFIYEKYAHLVKNNSRFYQASGVDIKAGFSGINVTTKPLSALISGAIAFETKKSLCKNPVACKQNDVFKLYDTYDAAMANNTPVTILLDDGSGIQAGNTLLKYKGLSVGKVEEIKLDENANGVIAKSVFFETYRTLAKKSNRYRVIRPQVGLDGISGMDTLLSGPYIEVLLKKESAETSAQDGLGKGPLQIMLLADRAGSVSVGAPVFYRQIKVGRVIDVALSETSENVEFKLSIQHQYAPLVREHSKFWNASGVNVDINPLSINIKTESVMALLSGGISFATPEKNKNMGNPAETNAVFELHDTPKDKWLEWEPEISLNK